MVYPVLHGEYIMANPNLDNALTKQTKFNTSLVAGSSV